MSTHDGMLTSWADPDMAEMEKVAAAMGKKGNLYAIDLSLRLRQSRGQRVSLDLPPLDDIQGVKAAQGVVIQTAFRGDVPIDAGLKLTTLLDRRLKLFIAVDYEARLQALEDADRPAKPPKDQG